MWNRARCVIGPAIRRNIITSNSIQNGNRLRVAVAIVPASPLSSTTRRLATSTKAVSAAAAPPAATATATTTRRWQRWTFGVRSPKPAFASSSFAPLRTFAASALARATATPQQSPQQPASSPAAAAPTATLNSTAATNSSAPVAPRRPTARVKELFQKLVPPDHALWAYFYLTKMKLTTGVMWSHGMCLWIGAVAYPSVYASWSAMILAFVGTVGCVAGANVFNQMWEVERDRKMMRTRLERPLCTERFTMPQAWAVGLTHAVGGTGLLYAVNPALAAIGGSTVLAYLFAYTWMKPRSEWNTAVGAVVGAMPPVMGIAAVLPAACSAPTLLAGLEAVASNEWVWFVFLYQFIWQMVHFVPMQYNLRDDYNRGGFRMLSRDDADGKRSAQHTFAWMSALTAVGFMPVAFGLVSPMFALTIGSMHAVGMLLALRFLNATRSLANTADSRYRGAHTAARHVRWFSYGSLLIAFFLFLFHSIPFTLIPAIADWSITKQIDSVSQYLHRRFCTHPTHKAKATAAAAAAATATATAVTPSADAGTGTGNCVYVQTTQGAKKSAETGKAIARAATNAASDATAATAAVPTK